MHPRIAELGLRLALELRIGQLGRDHGRQTLADVLSLKALVFLLENPLVPVVLVAVILLLVALMVVAGQGGTRLRGYEPAVADAPPVGDGTLDSYWKLGIFYYGLVIPGLALRQGTIHQYPLYDALAMGIQMMVFTYLLGRTDAEGRNVIEMWADNRSKTRLQSSVLSIIAVIAVGNVLYAAVFAPHLATKLGGWVTAGPTGQLFPGVPNQPR